MADIKTREVDKSSIKTLDRSVSSLHRLRDAGSEIRQAGRKGEETAEQSVSEYYTGNFEAGTRRVAARAEQAAELGMNKGAAVTRQKMRELSMREKKRVSTEREFSHGDPLSVKSENRKRGRESSTGVKGRASEVVKGGGKSKRQLGVGKSYIGPQKQKAVKNAYRKPKTIAGTTRRAASSIARSARALYLSVKMLITGLIAGGWIAITVIVCCVLFGAAFYFFGDENAESYIPVSPEVEAYTELIEKYCKEYDMPEYTELVKAVMMQESAGKGKDPMQSSECEYNTRYPKKPNGITDPEYSVYCGIRYLKKNIDMAQVSSPVDMDRIKLALQGYNFGSGYISWALSKYGGYSYAGAAEFAKIQAEKMGTDSYGDKDYVEHVLKYYPYGNYTYDVMDNGNGVLGLPIKGMSRGNISSHFGPRSSPGGIGSTNHQGLDIAFPTGTKVLACESGTIVSAGWNGGLGKCVIIQHGANLQTVYGHMSMIHVKAGQMVVRGQVIGEVGSTGDSTGPHLHLGVKLNKKFVNPEKGYLSIPK